MSAPVERPVERVAPAVAPQPSESNWNSLLKNITQIALHVLIPMAACYLSYLSLPVSALAIGMPLVTLCTAFVVSFFIIGEGKLPFAQEASPLPPQAPRGIRNGAMNCWLNSLLQTVRGDRELKTWFLDFPNEWERIQRLPLFTPQFFPLNPLPNGAPPQNYLERYYPRLHATLENPQNLPNLPGAKSYYQLYCGPFEGSDEEFLAHLQNQQTTLDLYEQDRQKLDTFFQIVQEAPQAARYFAFFAEVPPEERLARKDALAAFQLFLQHYDQAQEANLPRVEFASQHLREALSHISALIDPNSGVQFDPMEALTVIGYSLMPRDLKVAAESHIEYQRGANPAMEGGEVVRRREEAQLGTMQLIIRGNQPNIQEMIREAADVENENLELLIRQRAIDGLNYEYLVEREGRQFVQAPSSLWLQIKRMENVKTSSWECLQRLMPTWFSGRAVGLQKVDTLVTAQPEVTLQLAGEEEVQYQLGGIIVHRGDSLRSGHYVSYQRIEIEPGRWVWFEMNDSSVRQLTDDEAARVAKQGYAYHYSRVG